MLTIKVSQIEYYWTYRWFSQWILVLSIILSLINPIISLFKPGFTYKGHPGQVKPKLTTNHQYIKYCILLETHIIDYKWFHNNFNIIRNNPNKLPNQSPKRSYPLFTSVPISRSSQYHHLLFLL